MKVSILLPNFNHAAFLPQALDAIRAQTHSDWELAIVDDASTDGSRSVIEDHAKRDSRIRTEFLPRNGGVVAALRLAYAKTDGPLVLGAAADDHLVDTRFLEKAVSAFQATPDIGCVFARADEEDEASGERRGLMGQAPHAGQFAPREATREFFMGRLFIHGAAVVWRRDLVDKVGGYDPELGPQSDFFINHALAALRGTVFLDEVVTVVRTSATKFSRSTNDEQHFRAYAGVEARIRALDLGYRISPAWLREWRYRTMNERMAIRWQRRFFDAILPRRRFMGITWQAPLLPPDLVETVRVLHGGIEGWSRDFEERVRRGEAIFDDVAGRLPGAAFRSSLQRLVRSVRKRMM